MPLYLKAKQVPEYTNRAVSQKQVYAARKRGELECIALGTGRNFITTDVFVDRWLMGRATRAVTPGIVKRAS